MKVRVVARLDIAALRHNFSIVKQYAPHSKIMLMLKADAYGHGLLTVATALKDADAFAVHCIDDAILLRQHFPKKRIILLSGVMGHEGLASVLDHGLELVVHQPQQLKMLAELPKLPESARVRVWVKVNTGMNRLGFLPEQLPWVYQTICASPGVQHDHLHWMTHFSSAGDIDNPETQRQIEVFRQSVAKLPGEKTLANSAGILAWPESHVDWVRPGIMLYGGSPFETRSAEACHLRPVMTLMSKIIATQPVKQGQQVGYDGSWVAPRDSFIGIVSVGYGDGYPRHARTGTPVLVGNTVCPLVGKVCMDLIHIDLTDHPGVNIGQDVVLWGDGLPVEDIARYSSTVSYELFCHVSSSVKVEVVGCVNKRGCYAFTE